MIRKTKSKLVSIVRAIYEELLVDQYKDQNFWVFAGFIPALVAARLVVRFDPHIFLHVHGHHVHHFTYGFILLAVTGFIAVNLPRRSPPWLAFLFGIGLALALDESGMWVNLTNQYYNETTENVLIFAIVLLVNLVYFSDFWIRLVREIYRTLRRK